jgi:dimeric dUTPase (all-alpha-NTP-PPase superfamily)
MQDFYYKFMDKLESIFELQAALNKKIGLQLDGLTDEEKKTWILNYARALSQEVAELTDSVPWKWWARYQKFDAQNVNVELIDLLHFLVSAFQVMGLSAEDVYRIYSQKCQINTARQEKGYTSKDASDCRQIQ